MLLFIWHYWYNKYCIYLIEEIWSRFILKILVRILFTKQNLFSFLYNFADVLCYISFLVGLNFFTINQRVWREYLHCIVYLRIIYKTNHLREKCWSDKLSHMVTREVGWCCRRNVGNKKSNNSNIIIKICLTHS